MSLHRAVFFVIYKPAIDNLTLRYVIEFIVLYSFCVNKRYDMHHISWKTYLKVSLFSKLYAPLVPPVASLSILVPECFCDATSGGV